MQRFPYITDYINEVFSKEITQWDFILLRPLLIVFYFFLRFISFPIKFILRRGPLGFEGYLIDFWMAFGIKYLARHEAAELFMRHVQIEPLLYRHMLARRDTATEKHERKLNGNPVLSGECCPSQERRKCQPSMRKQMVCGYTFSEKVGKKGSRSTMS